MRKTGVTRNEGVNALSAVSVQVFRCKALASWLLSEERQLKVLDDG